jgi:serine/threonine protein kinase
LKDRYHIKKKLTQGGFGKIYLGKDLETNNDIIVKLNAQSSMNDHEFEIMTAMSGCKGFPTVYENGLYLN